MNRTIKRTIGLITTIVTAVSALGVTSNVVFDWTSRLSSTKPKIIYMAHKSSYTPEARAFVEDNSVLCQMPPLLPEELYLWLINRNAKEPCIMTSQSKINKTSVIHASMISSNTNIIGDINRLDNEITWIFEAETPIETFTLTKIEVDYKFSQSTFVFENYNKELMPVNLNSGDTINVILSEIYQDEDYLMCESDGITTRIPTHQVTRYNELRVYYSLSYQDEQCDWLMTVNGLDLACSPQIVEASSIN